MIPALSLSPGTSPVHAACLDAGKLKPMGQVQHTICLFFGFFLVLYMCVCMYLKGEGQREREKVRIPSRLCAVSTDPDAGLDLMNHEIMT